MPTGGLNLFGLHQFDYKDSFFSEEPVFSQGVGYGIVIGYGAFFVLLTMMITLFDRIGGTKSSSEEFNTAGRHQRTGLMAVDAISRWTWVAVILISTSETYLYGICGALWMTVSALVPLFLFGILALDLKHKAPLAHTVIELVHLRWGKTASFVFMYMCLVNNTIVSLLLFIGAGSVLSALTGMNIYAALVLLPLGVVIYTFYGGLKATFTSSYVHTVIIFVTVNIFTYTVYTGSKEPVGSIGDIWENLNQLSTVVPVKGNKHGSYLTMFSKFGLQVGVWNLIASVGNLIADQAYWQAAIAASPKAAFNGYILGGLLWLPIPFALATAMGLVALALDLPISSAEFNQGLVIVAVAQYLLGKGGLILILTIVFMSVTSSGSAEFMAMSSLWTYDIYKRYINPKASGKRLLLVSRVAVAFVGLLMAMLACVCKKLGIDVNFLFFVCGLIVSSAAPPLTLMLTWSKVPAGAAIAGALGGQALAIISWLAHTQISYGRLTVSDTLQRLGPNLDGSIVAILSSTVICVFWTLAAPERGDSFARWKGIQNMDTNEQVSDPKDYYLLQKHVLFNKYSLFAIALSVSAFIILPLLTLPAGVFSKSYFKFWVVLSMIWLTVASVVATVLPLVEARKEFLRIWKISIGY